MTRATPSVTDFSRDIMGRYICNGLDEALRSADRSVRPDARPFDIIVIGAGAIGGAVAQHLFDNDKSRRHRILVLEAGPFVLPEHLQNLPLSGLNIYGPAASSIAELRAQGNYGLDKPRDEIWGLPWHSSTPFPGLAYAIGGRSLAWGGWSPTLLDQEFEDAAAVDQPWPQSVIDDLRARYYPEARAQLGVDQTNDFIYGELQDVMRRRLYEGIRDEQVTGALPFHEIPLVYENAPSRGRNAYRLEAPLAVETRTRAGFFPVNKYSSVPLLMKAARSAYLESNHDDVKKRLMVVPQVHIKRLVTEGRGGQQRVVGIETNQGNIPVPSDGAVVLAMGTIESTRLAQISFPGMGNAHLMGQNLIGDMISLLLVRVPRSSLPLDETVRELQVSALFTHGRHEHKDGTAGHFHVQIVGSGLGPWDFNAEAEIYQKVPDLDTMQYFKYSNDTHVVIAVLGVAKMEPQNLDSFVKLDPELDEFGEQRAFVSIQATEKDKALWAAMDRASDDVAKVFANGQPYEVITYDGIYPLQGNQSPMEVLPYEYRHFGLGDSHHEAGTLWMGESPFRSVTDANGRFHYVSNAYVASPATFPTNAAPVLTGVALGRRLADHLVPEPTPYVPREKDFVALFDGIMPYTWQMLGSGGFAVVDGALESIPGDDLGLYWCTTPLPTNFILKLEWLRWQHEDNSGVFLRFPDPHSQGYMNPAYVGVDFGFEVQIDETGAPDGADVHKTGAIYDQRNQRLSLRSANPPGSWNEFTIRVEGQRYTVWLNGQQVTQFENRDERRGRPSTPKVPSFLGFQGYPGSRVAFRNIRIRELPADTPQAE